MSAAAEVVSAAATENRKSQNPNEGWTLVLPRRAKNRSKKSQIPKSQSSKIPIPWVPTDLGSSQTDPSTESKLLQKIQLSVKKLESSDFYRALADQLRTPQILHSICRALSSHLKMPMVIYGIGSIGSYDPSRLQLALAILLQRDFDWIGRIEIFDPVISAVESRVMAALDCSVLSVDEQGRRAAEEPTLFFMPHCEAVLYDNLIEANWRPERLNRIVVFGNSFGHYRRVVSEFKGSAIADSARHVLAVGRFVEEVGIETVSDDFFRAFHETSWHFFDLDPGMDMESVKLEREL
ncbi:protein SENSITIVITY TO RED LIGHT REDUCED 1 [Magnolia sinica]|uniref:protein SENSITIVITY TO RED LIGHT REDUCED 1 n=1 Tax=Magnolia sinica TaxID=86752 RepID=UPI00265A16CE|nr:protein SENSITIVITY TO RED LIGHT REDUCED 1 [Magnolia sinica]